MRETNENKAAIDDWLYAKTTTYSFLFIDALTVTLDCDLFHYLEYVDVFTPSHSQKTINDYQRSKMKYNVK